MIKQIKSKMMENDIPDWIRYNQNKIKKLPDSFQSYKETH